MRNKATVVFSILCILIGSIGAIAPLASARAADRSPTTSHSSTITAPVLHVSGSPVKVYDTRSLLAQPGVRVVTVAEKTTKMAHKLSGVGPDVPVDDGFDQGYFFISLNWVYSGGSFDCGYMFEETESTTGPATGNMQGELHVTQKVANQYITYNPWNFDQDFVNGLGQESGCYAYETNSYWLGEGAGALQWPDGNQDASGNQYVDGDQP